MRRMEEMETVKESKDTAKKVQRKHWKQRTTEISAQLLPTSIALLQYLDLDHHPQIQMRKPTKHSKIEHNWFWNKGEKSKTYRGIPYVHLQIQWSSSLHYLSEFVASYSNRDPNTYKKYLHKSKQVKEHGKW